LHAFWLTAFRGGQLRGVTGDSVAVATTTVVVVISMALALQTHAFLQPALSFDAQESNTKPSDDLHVALHRLRLLLCGGHSAVVVVVEVEVVVVVVVTLTLQTHAFLQPASSFNTQESNAKS